MAENLSKQFGASSETYIPPEQGKKEPEGLEVRFDSKTGTLLLGLGDKDRLDPAFVNDVENRGFAPKEELHMTVIGFKQGNQLKKAIKQNPELADKIAALASETEWAVQPTGERYELSKQYEGEDVPRKSIIEMVSCPGAETFAGQLNTLTGLQLEEQPPHVTLATQGNPQGIGVNTGQDIIDLGQRIA